MKNKILNKEDIVKRIYNHNDYRRLMQVRALDVEENDEQKMLIEGKAVAFDEETVLFKYEGIDYKEIINKGALDEADISQAFLKYNHTDSIMAMARTKNGTLKIDIKEDGVYFLAELANTTAGRDLYELVRRGDIDKMSFAFTIKEESYDKKQHLWTIKKIDKLYDVAAVTIPAYNNTEVFARRYDDAEACRKQEVETSELERTRKVLRIRLEMTQKKKFKERTKL